MGIREYSISSLADLLERLPSLHVADKTVWFRGHAEERWHLEPSLSRRNKLNCEMQLIKRFKQDAIQFLDRVPDHEYEWIFLMQHYRVPTRLLYIRA